MRNGFRHFEERSPVGRMDATGIVRKRVCQECEGVLQETTGSCCLKCGRMLADETTEYCAGCRNTPHAFDRGFALFTYRSAAASIYRFKYRARWEYAAYYAERAAAHIGSELRGLCADALVPVPMHPRRQRERGRNQAEVLARALGRSLGIPVYARLMRRVKYTPPQKGLEDGARRNNLKNAFHIRNYDVELKTVIIVDDIYTTGSTVDAVARTLRGAGVCRVYVLTLSIGQT